MANTESHRSPGETDKTWSDKILLACLVVLRLNKPNKEVVFQPAVMGNRQPVCDYRDAEQ